MHTWPVEVEGDFEDNQVESNGEGLLECTRSDPCIDGLGASEKSLWLWAAGLLDPTEEAFWTDVVSDGCVPSLEMTGRAGSAVLTEFGSDLAIFANG